MITYYPNYQITKEIPRNVYKPSYPAEINSLGDLIRKTRIDLNLEVKQLGKELGVDECSITNWEVGRSQPKTPFLKRLSEFLKPHINGLISEEDLWKLFFQNNPSYPKQQNTFGDRLRAARMQSFLTIPQLADKLKVDPASIGKWERMEAKPIPEYKDRVNAWLKKNDK
ncbi:helix-turn-helix transcriptional regulator [Desulfobacula sp.]|uniref:helix-turn-helix domain-containing protein n=1 Tax=Desulfobacula sp. TaxID=2593537 RepID=UPI002628FE4B|nr:helix-turn-helix transcriptional regulator [Desulfobacula sp.]